MNYWWHKFVKGKQIKQIAMLLAYSSLPTLYGCASSAPLLSNPVPVRTPASVNIQIPKPLRTPETPTDDAILELIQGAMKAASAGIMRNEKAVAIALGLDIQPNPVNGNLNQITAGIPALDLNAAQHIYYGVKTGTSTRSRWGLSIDLIDHPICVTREKIEAAIGKTRDIRFGLHDSKYVVFRYRLENHEEKIWASFTYVSRENSLPCLMNFSINPILQSINNLP